MEYRKGKGDSTTREMAEQNRAKKLQGVRIVMNRNKCEEIFLWSLSFIFLSIGIRHLVKFQGNTSKAK